MPRYIDADRAHKDCEMRFADTGVPCEWALALRIIDNAPTADVVEVVRCKECKHHNETWCDMNSRDRGEWFCWYDDDFCSYGERRNDV